MHGLCGSNFYVSCVGYVGQNIFYMVHNFYVGCVGQKFLRGSIFFTWVRIFCLSQFFCGGLNFCFGHFFGEGGSQKNLDWQFTSSFT